MMRGGGPVLHALIAATGLLLFVGLQSNAIRLPGGRSQAPRTRPAAYWSAVAFFVFALVWFVVEAILQLAGAP